MTTTTIIIIITGARTAPAENMYHVSWLYASEKSPPYIRIFFFFFMIDKSFCFCYPRS